MLACLDDGQRGIIAMLLQPVQHEYCGFPVKRRHDTGLDADSVQVQVEGMKHGVQHAEARQPQEDAAQQNEGHATEAAPASAPLQGELVHNEEEEDSHVQGGDVLLPSAKTVDGNEEDAAAMPPSCTDEQDVEFLCDDVLVPGNAMEDAADHLLVVQPSTFDSTPMLDTPALVAPCDAVQDVMYSCQAAAPPQPSSYVAAATKDDAGTGEDAAPMEKVFHNSSSVVAPKTPMGSSLELQPLRAAEQPTSALVVHAAAEKVALEATATTTTAAEALKCPITTPTTTRALSEDVLVGVNSSAHPTALYLLESEALTSSPSSAEGCPTPEL